MARGTLARRLGATISLWALALAAAAKPLDALDVFADAELVVDVGFPAGSML
ncbi:hypothetical protein WMF26_40290 [Sorangium sp. So ce185]|uniref:hypothetical protein n=1 Tax=Sorangium sp. So ce185 TaxID=3133287 RepID=UPI003F6252F2